MDAIGYHIERIRQANGWKSVQLEERIWSYLEWAAAPTLELNADFLLVSFHCYIPAVGAVTGDFTFVSAGTAQTVYNKTTCKIGANTTDWWMDSDRVTVHRNKLTVTAIIGAPLFFGHVKLIIVREGL